MTRFANDAAPVRREPGKKHSFVKTALLITSGLSGVMLGFAMPNLVSGSGMMVAIKSALLAMGGMTVAYVVNHLAVERGAPLTVAGYAWAGAVSAASILIVGGGMFSATYAGLTFRDVERLRIEAHSEALRDFVSDRSASAAQSSGIIPAINAVVADLTQKRDCEIAESCVSGRGSGGNGPVARVFTEKVGKATALAQQAEQGEAAREQALVRINTLFGQYQTVASGDMSLGEMRQALRGIDLNIRQAVADLDKAVPVDLLAAYGRELNGNVEIEGRPDVSRRITDILRSHGQAIGDVVRGLSADNIPAPSFPPQTGVADTFSYIGHFAPIAAITLVIEFVLPICVWLYTLFALSWSAHRVSPPTPRSPHPDDVFFREMLPGLANAVAPTKSEADIFHQPPATHSGTGRPRSRVNGDARGTDATASSRKGARP